MASDAFAASRSRLQLSPCSFKQLGQAVRNQVELLIGCRGRLWCGSLKSFHYHLLDELSEASDRRESAARGPVWLVNQRYGRLMLLGPTAANLHLDINRLHPGEAGSQQFRHLQAVAQTQNAMRDARMQTYRAASASGGFANIDLNPRRPTTNRTAIRITNARNKYRTKGVNQDASQINIPWCAHWILPKPAYAADRRVLVALRRPDASFLRQPKRCRSFLRRAVRPAGLVRS